MNAIERRIVELEAAERERILALPYRELLERGYLGFLGRLPEDDRLELEGILYLSFTDAGDIDHMRLTATQKARGVALMLRLGDTS